MIACACGMSEWSVECECVCSRMDEWMVSGWNECDCVAQAPGNTGWKLNCSQLLWSIYIYYDRSVSERPETERQEREDRNKECPFGRLLLTSLKPTLHMAESKCRNLHQAWKFFPLCKWPQCLTNYVLSCSLFMAQSKCSIPHQAWTFFPLCKWLQCLTDHVLSSSLFMAKSKRRNPHQAWKFSICVFV